MGTDVTEAHLGQRDLFSWRMERDPLLRSTIVAVAVLDRVPDRSQLVDRVDRATRLTPTFRQKLVPTPLGLAAPRWVIDPDFDLSWHLRFAGVPDGGDLDDVLAMARVAGMTAFDPARPLWEITVVDGLPEDAAAMIIKVHHALTDGIGGLEIAAGIVDLERRSADLGPLPDAPDATEHTGVGDLRQAVGHDLAAVAHAAGDQLAALPGRAAGALRDPVGAAGSLVATARSIGRFVAPVSATASPVMTDRRLQWRYQAMTVPLDGLRQAAAEVDGTVNDAFVAGVTGGLRRYHERHEAPVAALHMTMPISTRRPGDAAGGNRITIVRFEVPVATADPAQRMREVDELCAGLRREEAIPYSDVIAAALNLLPAGYTGSMLKHVDVLASNVPGWPDPVYLGGARVEAFHAFGPTIGAAANVTLMSYRETCWLGVTTDVGAVPDADAFAECLVEGFDEVIEVGGAPERSRLVGADRRSW